MKMSSDVKSTVGGNLLPLDGEAYFYPDFFSAKESDALMFALQTNIDWKQEPIKIMGKEVMQPRLTAWHGDAGRSYRYSGISMDPAPWNTELLVIKEKIERVSGQTFNSVLLNFYRNGQDSMGWHRDNEKSLGIDPVIGSVSFGTARMFQFKHRQQPELRERILLTNGSFLLMKGSTQHHWHHSIPKESKVSGVRINLTFRTII
jgi:alkylated DNA repair dioxygenase AlkB